MSDAVIRFLTSKNIYDLKGISSDFNRILSTLSAKNKGRVCETVFKLALFLRIPIQNLPDGMVLYEDNDKVLRIADIGFGTKSGGCDITAVGDNLVGFGTSKIKYVEKKQKTQWNQIEWHKVLGEAGMTRNFDGYNKAFIAVVTNKDDLEDKAVPSYIRENFSDKGRMFIYDISDLVPLWTHILKVCRDNNWNTSKVEESCRNRVVLVPMEHQTNCIDMGVSKTKAAMDKGERINFLIADKPRAGKTIEMTSILVQLHNLRKAAG